MQQLDSETLQASMARRAPSGKASEQGRTLFARREFIGRRDKEYQAFDPRKSWRNGWLALRELILPCCWCELSSNTSLRGVVLLSGLTGWGLLHSTQGKIVLLTAAWLPSDKTHSPSL